MNTFYDAGRQAFLEKKIDWLNDTIRIVLIDSASYTLDAVNHKVLADIAAVARVATSAGLSGKTSLGGWAGAADVTLSAVTGASIEAAAVYMDSGNPATSPLIAYVDSGPGFPLVPSGGDVVVRFPSGPNNGLFRL